MTKKWFDNKNDNYRYRKEKKEEVKVTMSVGEKQSFFKKAFTPKDVEELKPNFFVQKKGDTYRQVQPLVWNGKWRLKNQIKLRNILMIVLIIALYLVGMKYVNFYEEVNSNPKEFCQNVSILNIGEVIHEDSSSLLGNLGEAEWNIP